MKVRRSTSTKPGPARRLKSLCGAVSVAGLLATSQAWAQADHDLPVRGAALYTSGVGYFLHEGEVEAGASVKLDFRADQINDVLKSLVLQSLDGGQPGLVVYPSQDPIAKTLGKYQINLSGNPTLSNLLAQVRGTRVTVRHQGETVTGVVLGVEQRQIPGGDGPPVTEWVLNLSNDGGLRSFNLPSLTDVQLLDPEVRRDLERALATLDRGRRRDTKPISLSFPGEGTRKVRLGYVIETPVWKTSYRLVLPEKEGDKAHLQGWAIVENQTEADWNDLTLSLISGRPISFIQDLYSPLYASRPVVRVKMHAGVAPRMDEGGQVEQTEATRVDAVAPGEPQKTLMAKQRRMMNEGFAMAPAAEPSMEMDVARGGGVGMLADVGADDETRGSSLDPRGVAAQAQAQDVGELFRYVVGKVNLPRQSSAMIPIVASPIDAEKVSVYNPAAHRTHALNGVLLTNSTELHLMNGPVTLFEDTSYGGDALMDDLPSGQHRLLTYAMDLETYVTTDDKGTNDITTGQISRGVLVLRRKHRKTRIYKMQNKGDRDRLMLVEHVRQGGFDLKEPDKPFETTDALYRFKVPVPKDVTGEFTVVEERSYSESISLLQSNGPRLAAYARNGSLPDTVRAALTKTASYWSQIEETRRAMQVAQEKVQQLGQDQNRVRENLRRVQPNSSFYQRMMKKMASIETDIERNQQLAEDLREKHEKRLAAYQDFLAKLNVE